MVIVPHGVLHIFSATESAHAAHLLEAKLQSNELKADVPRHTLRHGPACHNTLLLAPLRPGFTGTKAPHV